MQKRRQFLKATFRGLIGMGLLFSPVFELAQRAYAKTKKIILPKDIDRDKLIYKNPALLDTRNLEPTPLKDFRTMGDTGYNVDINVWRLEVSGLVETPLRLSYPEMLALDSTERNVLLICRGFFTNHGRWKGLSMEKLFGKAQMHAGVTHVTFSAPRGAGGNEATFPLAEVLSDRIFLAYGVNSVNLPQKHGFPLRLVAEGYPGSDWVKYVNRVRLDKT